ncbi:hypothetical protein [Bradymonas sediminis]|uniref:Uncharacterized protein n=1 Tax=Bradymonas sediminis TaxID=1548548 RepID=A0A2Z4FMQ7_9DELT|nr:hypothetical protein [Bradymonas sediminis]AWV89974.1 hypothetical protein DN745_11755 [Bradymonas sediminis]TDP76072.1 hypothetical protein DFR33_103423 [Bradymonas sediminis]
MNDANPPELPEINQGLLDAATLAQYYQDLELTRVFGVMVKGGPERYANEQSVPLETARQLLADGLCHGIQIRYIWQDEEWWDTLVGTGDGVRLVRIKHAWDGE